MTAEELGVAANWVATIMSLLGVVWISAVRITSLQVKVDTIWSFLMKRALSEALVQGVATRNSPVRVTDEAKQWMSDLIPPIRDFCARLGRRNITDNDLAIEIERRFGEQILNEVCIPHGLYMGACLLIAVQAVKDASP
jgi:hypothetical protein